MPIHGTDEIADVTGAGDTVISTFTVALAAGTAPARRRGSPTWPAAWWS
jgi:bifunctional ADP-heptose synthase (sugar kinase/adenylyltransferase)